MNPLDQLSRLLEAHHNEIDRLAPSCLFSVQRWNSRYAVATVGPILVAIRYDGALPPVPEEEEARVTRTQSKLLEFYNQESMFGWLRTDVLKGWAGRPPFKPLVVKRATNSHPLEVIPLDDARFNRAVVARCLAPWMDDRARFGALMAQEADTNLAQTGRVLWGDHGFAYIMPLFPLKPGEQDRLFTPPEGTLVYDE